LLDALDVERAIIVGVSAGAPSAVELVLRHPDRASALILIVPRAYAPGMEPVGAPPDSNMVMDAVIAGADFIFWLATKVARPLVVRFLGVPPEIEAKAASDDRRKVSDIMRSILPLSRRLPGLLNDSRAVIGEWPLEQVTVPTLVISAEDDLYRTPRPARHVAQGIAGAELLMFESGGHLLVGRGPEIRAAIRSFLRRPELLARAA
jgi:pimeloyl-ACP methyl ester carboxylesterase